MDNTAINNARTTEEPVPPRSYVAQIVSTVLTIINGLIIVRIILSAFGANRDNGFADFIYSVTHPLVSPFFGLFSTDIIYGEGGRIELESIFAILIYSLVAYAIVKIIFIGRRTRVNP